MIPKVLLSDPFLCGLLTVCLAAWGWSRWGSGRPGQGTPEAYGVLLLRVCAGLLMILASVGKLGDAAKFAKTVEAYQLLPGELVPLAAVVLPWLEFLMGVCLVAGFRSRGAALLLCALMGAYSLGLGINLLRGIEMTCKCFDPDSTASVTWLTVLRDLLLAAAGWIVLAAGRSILSLDGLLCRERSGGR